MAMHYFKNILDAEPNDSEANLAMGESLLKTKQYADATFYFNRVLQLEPENKRAQRAKDMSLNAIEDMRG